jgi:hypothetical protein
MKPLLSMLSIKTKNQQTSCFLKILKYGNLDRTDFYTKQKGYKIKVF